MTPIEVAGLLVWGTMVGVDLITGPQSMVARPLVAGTVAGLIVGDPLNGFLVGSILECCALQIMPFGSVRYADYGLGAVSGVVVAAGSPDVLGVGLAILIALLIALGGEWGTQAVRRLNSRDALRHGEALDRGDAAAIIGLHWRCIGRDVARSFSITAFGVATALVIRAFVPIPLSAAIAGSLAAIGVGVGSALVGAGRYSRTCKSGTTMFLVGLAGGTAWVLFA